MSLYDKASLIMTPSGVKAEKLYSHKPHNGNGDFTHDRNLGTATRVNKDGLIETVAADVPRLDYPLIDGVVQDCPALLLEPARTQLVEYSEDFSNSSWTKIAISVSTNNTSSPDGSVTADKITESATSSEQTLYYETSVTTGTQYTLSLFVKKSERRWFILRFGGAYGAFTNAFAWFDLENGVLGSKESGIDNYSIYNYGNGWYKVTATATSIATATGRFFYGMATSDGGKSYTGDGTSGIFIWGAQLEQASYSTSYIPNDGTTATITRNADVCDSAGTSAEFNDSEGVLYAEIASFNDGQYKFIGLSDGTATNRLGLFVGNSNNKMSLESTGSGTNLGIYDKNITTLDNNKIAMKYKPNDCALWVNGFELGTDTSFAAFTDGTLTELSFYRGDNDYNFYGKTKELAVFKEALTDSELEALTSWDSFNDMAKGQEYTIR